MATEVERELGPELVGELAGWQPEGGVFSVYVEIDPADRGEGWRIALREQLADAPEPVVARIRERLPAEGGEHPSGRSQIGFIAAGGEREIWTAAQLGIGEVTVVHAPGPHLTPLVRLLDDGWPLGVVVASLERVRVLEWALGTVRELDGWELETTSLDWRERKAPVRGPHTGGTGVSAAGRDQHRQRIEHNRERFLKQAGELVGRRYGDRPWRRIVIVGDGDRPRLLAAGLGERARLVHEVRHDLIGEPAHAIGERIEEELEHLNREREERLIERIEQAIGTDSGAALGPDEVLRALEQGRASEVVFDSEREFEPIDGAPFTERLIALAAATGAEVTPAEGMAAAALAERRGAAALLRY